jgi:hypothetical protein
MSKKNEANAGQKRKPRGPTLSVKGLQNHKDAVADEELWELNNRLEILERLRKEEKLNTPFIALEALAELSEGVVSRRTERQLRTVWPSEWGNETITVPLKLLLALSEVWGEYRQPENKMTLGEAFEIEGGGQGKHSMKEKLATEKGYIRLARKVEILYIAKEDDEDALTLEEAIEEVAGKEGVAFETVKQAHKKYKKYIRTTLTDVGVLKG